MKNLRSIVTITLMLICISSVTNPIVRSTANDLSIVPSSISVQGEIVDNYANISYEMFFDNSASDTDKQIEWLFSLQNDMRLSNISLVLDEEIYWGRIMIEQEAIDAYNDSVAQNKSAVLVTRVSGGYSISFNILKESQATLTVFTEGLLSRSFGLYSLELPITNAQYSGGLSLNLSVRSNYDSIAWIAISGIIDYVVTDLTDGIQITYSGTVIALNSNPKLTYAMNRQVGGSQLLTYSNGTDSFFTYLLAPSIVEVTERVSRHYVFVIDTSGSMSGEAMEQAKTAFSSMISDLGENDLFNVISFNSEAYPLWDEPRFAVSSDVAYAQAWVDGLIAGGGTNFYDGCVTGLDNFYEGETVKVMLVLSDGLPSTGDITNAGALLTAITELNTLNVSISTIVFGSGADLTLMANLASYNYGFYSYIEPNEDASSKLIDFYKIMATPLASSYSIQVVGAIEITSLYPLSNSPFFNGSEFVLTGRYLDSLTIQTSITYASGPETYINTATTASSTNSHVELIWAQNRLNYLLKLVEITGSSNYDQEITSLALTYGLIIEGYTAIILVVTDPDDEIDEPNEPSSPPPTDNPSVTDPDGVVIQTAIDDPTVTQPADDEADSPFLFAPLMFGMALYVFMKRRKMKKVV